MRTKLLLFLLLNAVSCLDVTLRSGSQLHCPSEEVAGGSVDTCLGVPFGKPPVGGNRFSHAKPLGAWNGVLRADRPAPPCYQNKMRLSPSLNGTLPMSEDCLQLNIWAPSGGQNLPVMVWIFGGGFVLGSPSLTSYDGRYLASFGDVVVVNINYRVGPFGFLYLNTSSAPGNVGFMDQLLALKWIQENIEKFGGDPSRVTIFGESAGGASVTAHLIAPHSRDLFQYAIIQSGAMGNPWACRSPESGHNLSLELARRLNCSGDLEPCLQNSPANLIQEVVDSGMLFIPVCQDASFFPKDARQSINEGDFKASSILGGIMRDEGSLFLPLILPQYFNFTSESLIPPEEFQPVMKTLFGYSEEGSASPIKRPSLSEEALKMLAFEYGGICKEDSACFRDAVKNAFGDGMFACGIIDFVNRYQQITKGSVFLYEMSRRISTNQGPQWLGSMHGGDIEYTFGIPFLHSSYYTDNDRAFSKRLMTYWFSFAWTGRPVAKEWPPMELPNNYFIEFTEDGNVIGQNLKMGTCQFWKSLPSTLNKTYAKPISRRTRR